MDGNGGGGFLRNEAISAVQDEEQFYGEDEDYDDLYNDVNVGEGFYQSAQQRPAEEELPPRPLQKPPPAADLPDKVQIPGVAQEPKVEKPPDRSGGFPEPPPVQAQPRPPPVLVRPGLGQQQPSGTNFQNQPFHRQGGNFTGGNVNVNPNPNLNGGSGGNNNFGRGGGNNLGGGRGGNNLGGGSGGNNLGVAGGNYNGGGGGGGNTTLFVGDLHWWTTDADLESEVVKYGPVKEVKFFDEKASGKSKGYAQVDFFDPAAANACKEGMNGHIFNGRPCVVAFSTPYGVRRMGEAHVSRNQQAMAQNQNQNQNQSSMANKGRGGGGGDGGAAVGGNFGGRGGGGGGNWGRGGGGVGGRGPMGGNMRNRMGPVGGRGIMGNGGGMVAPPPPVMHPGMLGQGFDYGAAAMGRMGGGYGGFPAGPAAGPFPGMMPSFPPVVAPHVNPAFFGRGMPGGGLVSWQDPSMGGWGGEEQSSYGEDAGSEHHYGDGGSNGKGRVAERGPDRDWLGGSERRHEREKDVGGGQEWAEGRHRDDRERDRGRDWEREKERDRDDHRDRERDKYRDDRDRYGDHYRNRERDDEWDRGRSRGRSHSREVENMKRRRGSE